MKIIIMKIIKSFLNSNEELERFIKFNSHHLFIHNYINNSFEWGLG